jgi:hypothetical protein
MRMKDISSAQDASLLRGSVGLSPLRPPAHGERARPAEVRLAAAVFEDALRCLAGNIDAPAGPRWRELTEACDWIWSEGRDTLFAFDNVCDLLGLNPAVVRRRLQRAVARQARRVDSLFPIGTASVVQLDNWKAMNKRLPSRRRSVDRRSVSAQ